MSEVISNPVSYTCIFKVQRAYLLARASCAVINEIRAAM